MLDKMESDVSTTSDILEKDVQLLKEWVSNEPHLPKIESEEWLIMCLHHNKYNVEKTKTKIDNYFSYRNKYPAVLKNRDPMGLDIAQSRVAFSLSVADKLTKDGERLIFARFHQDPSLFDMTAVMKRGFMLADSLFFLLKDKHSSCVVVADCKHFSYKYFLKLISGIKTSIDIFFNAYSDRFKGYHLINLPVGAETLLNVLKTFLPKKYSDKLYIHSSPVDLCKTVDADVVCSDFGGKGPHLSVYDEYSTKLLEEHREWYLAQDSVCTNEKLRRKSKNKKEDMKDTFKKLEVD